MTVADVFDGYATLVSLVAPSVIAPTIRDDPTDDPVLAAALGAKADLIVSGDQHLLRVGAFAGIRIVTAITAVGRLALA